MVAPRGHQPYNIFGEGGRPKIYTQEMIESEADALLDWLWQDEKNFFIEDFCLSRGYSYKRLNEWVKANEKFSEAYDMFKTKQRVVLYKGGISKKFGYPMCALILSHDHGIHQKSEQKVTADLSAKSLLDEIMDQSRDLVCE
jgi:hypothetical protein